MEIIHSYTRSQAIEDGVLIDVSAQAKEAGVKFPVALTYAVWTNYVVVPEGVEAQDEAGRLWDIVWMFRQAARRTGGNILSFKLLVRNDNRGAKEVTLKAVCGPGDTLEPVITIMQLDED